MTQTLKCLAQALPTPNTLTTLYTVPSSTSTAVSSLEICNQSPCLITFFVSYAIAGASDTPAQYIYSQMLLSPGITYQALIGITMAQTDQLRMKFIKPSSYSGAVNVSAQLFGCENS